MTTKIVSFFFFILFGLFALWQINDPDPIIWVGLYGLLALISICRLFGLYNKQLVIIVGLTLLIYSFFFLPGFIEYLGKPDKSELFGEMIYDRPYIEQTREFLGLLIGAACMLVHFRLK